MKNIILNPDDMPTAQELIHTISRLRKDYRLLNRIRGAKDVEDPESFHTVASFLEMLLKREKRNLPKDKSRIGDGMEIMIDIVASHLLEMEDWELNRTVEETRLKKLFGRKE